MKVWVLNPLLVLDAIQDKNKSKILHKQYLNHHFSAYDAVTHTIEP